MTQLQQGQFVTIGREFMHRDQVIYFMTSSATEIERSADQSGDDYDRHRRFLCAMSTRSRRSFTGPAEKFLPVPERYLRRFLPFGAEARRDRFIENTKPQSQVVEPVDGEL